MIFLVFVFILFILLKFYIRMAIQYNITDKPNVRSSHDSVTVRGGGIIFPLSLVIYSLLTELQFPYFLLGLILISCVSFWDDLHTISNAIRIVIHIVSVSLLCIQSGLTEYPVWILISTLIIIIGIINAYNFMDGINGITVLYSISVTISLYIINQYVIRYIPNGYFIPVFSALLVFGFFNARKKALTFAGDVGSVSVAFIISFLIMLLMIKTQTIVWILLLGLYGIDTVVTIFFRLLRKENIFEAHRSHFFQFLANEKKYPHVMISIGYALVQLIINVIIIYSYLYHNWYVSLFSFLVITIFYFMFRLKYEGLDRLAKKY